MRNIGGRQICCHFSLLCRCRVDGDPLLSTGCRFGKLNPGVSVVQPALDYRIRVIVIEELIKRAKVDSRRVMPCRLAHRYHTRPRWR